MFAIEFFKTFVGNGIVSFGNGSNRQLSQRILGAISWMNRISAEKTFHFEIQAFCSGTVTDSLFSLVFL